MMLTQSTYRAMRAKAAGGFSLLELSVLISIMAILLDRIFWCEGQAEKSAMEHTADMIKTGLWMEAANLMMAERTSEITALAKRNSIGFLAQKSVNDLGEINAAQVTSIEADNWFYDVTKYQVMYVLDTAATLRSWYHFCIIVWYDNTEYRN
jgi:hypothetical protein